MKLHASGEGYLETILVLQKKLGMVCSIDVVRDMAEQTYEKHHFFTQLLTEAGVNPISAERDACRLEHVISQEAFEYLRDAYNVHKDE